MPTPERSPGPLIAVYDDDCRVCRVAVALVLAWDRHERVRPVGFGEADIVGAPIATDSWHLRDGSGVWHSAGAALAPLAAALPGGRVPARALRRVPRLAEGCYRFVARRRRPIGRVVPDRLVRWADRRIASRRR